MPRPTIPIDAVPLSIRVRYAETDQMRVAHHSAYYVWFEEGRAAFCRTRGLDYARMEAELGLFLPVVEARCRYIAPARYDELLTLNVYLAELTRRTVRFGCILERDGVRLAEGETYHVLVDSEGRPRLWPEEVRTMLSGKGPEGRLSAKKS